MWISLLQFLQCLDNYVCTSQSSCEVFTTLQDCVNTLHKMLQPYEKLMCKVVRLLQPWFHTRSYIFRQAKLIYDSSTLSAWNLKNPLKTVYLICKLLILLNQARAWFLKSDPVRIVGMRVRVCPRPRLLITSGVMWHGMNLIWLVKQVLQLLYGN